MCAKHSVQHKTYFPYNLFHRTFSTFIWLSCILHTICHAIPFLTNNALLDFTKCIQITKLTWVSPATNYFIFIITFYPVLKCLTDYKFQKWYILQCLFRTSVTKKKLGLLSVKSLHWHTIHLSDGLGSVVKGQIISIGLFGILKFSQKPNEWIRRISKNEFIRSFFGRIRGYQKVLSKLSDL